METPNDLVEHLQWADAEIWRAVLTQSEGAVDPKVHFWLHHIHTVQHAFLSVWRGEDLDLPEESDFSDALALARWGREAHAGLRDYLFGADEATLNRELEFPWSEQLEEKWGKTLAPVTLAQTAVQVAMHSTHHRGQVAARLRELGGEPPQMDFLAWLWWGRPAARWPNDVER